MASELAKSLRPVSNFRRRRGLSARQKLALTGAAFTLPSVVLFCTFQLYPIFNTILLSFFKYDLLTPKKYIGLGNFADLFSDSVFWESCLVTLIYVVGVYAPVFVIALGLGLALKSTVHLQGTFRTIVFLPNVVSIVAIGVIWKLIFHPSGLSAELTRLFTPDPVVWLHHPATAQIAVIVSNVWREVGYFTVLFMAGLLGIPDEYYEAATIDGAGRAAAFAHITLPLLRRTTLFVIVLCMVRGVQTFVPQFIMTRGGPGISNTTIGLSIYNNAFVYYKMGRASAMALLVGLVVMVFTVIQLRLFRETGKD
jgi:multiple sugar transport system permease protein